MFRNVLYLLKIVLLTLVTQIGGVIYLVSIFIINNKKSKFKRTILFFTLYFFATFYIVPKAASLCGREKIKDSSYLVAHSVFYKVLNRDYVKPQLNKTLIAISESLHDNYNGIQLVYLDANFPFFDGFPLLPHLSHNDGKKIDICFIYKSENGKIENKKQSRSGYGIYENPLLFEVNQNNRCKQKGYWQYDFPKYLSLGTVNKNIEFSEKATKKLLQIIEKQPKVSKIFIEPHLKNRMNLMNSKIRYHGCQAVRHDDHIHFQIK